MADARLPDGSRVNAVIAPLALDGLGGGRIDLAARKGRVVLLHFFATWCEPCIREWPQLDRLAGRRIPRGVAARRLHRQFGRQRERDRPLR